MEIIRKSKDDLKKVSFWTECTCEFLATTILMTVVVFVIVSNSPLYTPTTTHFGLFVAGFVFMILEAYGPVACLMNPMAIFSLFLAGKVSLAKAIIFSVVEVLGATAGTWLGYCLTPDGKKVFEAFNPALHNITNLQAVVIEAFFSFNLIFVVLSCHGNDLPRTISSLPNLAIAFALAVGLWAAGTHTGGFMNPLISFGPAQLANDFTNHWVYWVGPYIGGPLAVPVYKLFVLGKKYESRHQQLPTTENIPLKL